MNLYTLPLTVSFVSDNKVTVLMAEQMGHTHKDGLPATHSQKPCYHLNQHSLKSVCTNRFFRPAFSWHPVPLINIIQSLTLFRAPPFTVTNTKSILALAFPSQDNVSHLVSLAGLCEYVCMFMCCIQWAHVQKRVFRVIRGPDDIHKTISCSLVNCFQITAHI